MPTLSVLIEYSSNVRIIRKFLRSRILPPLRDVTHRPEEGNQLRNKLCRLMTCTITQVEFLVAEFLFILCKENGQFLLLADEFNLFQQLFYSTFQDDLPKFTYANLFNYLVQ